MNSVHPEADRENAAAAAGLVKIGEIVKPHSIRGEVKVYPYSGQPENFRDYRQVVLQEQAAGGMSAYKVVNSRGQGKLAILQLEGVTDREAAAALSGRTVWVKKSDFPALKADEYYWHQLEGLMVATVAGRELGRVASLFHTAAHDIMVVTGAGREYLIPVKAEFIREIDERHGKLLIEPPPGLLEANTED